MFDLTIGFKKDEVEVLKINTREAVRGVILNESNLLMIHTNKGDYKFPGGGINQNESKMVALIREIEEESGYVVKTVDRLIGQIVERDMDTYEENAIFEMISSYYMCSVLDIQKKQHLDVYEEKMGFQPIWIDLEEAILHNEKLLESNADVNRWLTREIMALKEIMKVI
jgi:8-oxo-dGTP pyrophosphatase MutT (NUDIX family)